MAIGGIGSRETMGANLLPDGFSSGCGDRGVFLEFMQECSTVVRISSAVVDDDCRSFGVACGQ